MRERMLVGRIIWELKSFGSVIGFGVERVRIKC